MSVTDRLKLPQHAPAMEADARRAAVAVIFGPDDELLFIHRAERAGDLWSGHMAFPGGREDPEDESLFATVLRETLEELGLDLSSARCLGALSPLLSPRNTPNRQIHVLPWVFRLDHWPPLFPNEEVAGVVRFDFRRCLAREARGTVPYTWQGTAYDLPCVQLDGTLLWGMSLRMVDEIIEHAEAG